MNEIYILIAVILAILTRIFIKEHVEFKMPEIIKYQDGTRVLKLNILFTFGIGFLTALILYNASPESFISPIVAFLTVFGANSFTESVGTKLIENE